MSTVTGNNFVLSKLAQVLAIIFYSANLLKCAQEDFVKANMAAMAKEHNCSCCRMRPELEGDHYCTVCKSYLSKELVWKCRRKGHVQNIPFPLADDDTWACHQGCNDFEKWDPVNEPAIKLRKLQDRSLGAVTVNYTDSLGGSTSFQHYLKHYNKCKRDPTMVEVRHGMVNLAAIVGQGIQFNISVVDSLVSSETDVDYLYTTSKFIKTVAGDDIPFYFFINRFLHEKCDCVVMDAIMPFIRRLNHKIVSNPYSRPESKLYRSQTFMDDTIEMLKNIKPPRSIRIPGFLSTSLKENLESFKGNANLIIHVFSGCPNAYYLAESSEYKEEAEVLFPPYSAFIVTRTEMLGGVLQIWMDAQDNGSVGEEFDRILIHDDEIKLPPN